MDSRSVGFYPWTVNWQDVLYIVLGGLLLIAGIYLSARGGRDRHRTTDHPGKPPLRNYAGIVRTDSNPATVFVLVFSVLIILWAVWYVVQIAALGLKY